jgi:O-antigen ligase
MNFDKSALQQKISLAALTTAVITLPFSIKICHGALIVLVLNWLWEGQWKTKWQMVQQNILLWPTLLFFLVCCIGLLYSDDFKNGVSNLEKKSFFFLVPLVLATTKIDPSKLKFVLKSFVATCLAAVIVCTVLAFYKSTLPFESRPYNFDYYATDAFRLQHPQSSPSWHLFSYQEFASGINMHPTYFSLYLLFAILSTLYLIKDVKFFTWFSKSVILSVMSILSLGLLFLSSRVIIICYFLMAILTLIYFFRRTKSNTAIILTISVFIISLSLMLLQPITSFRTFHEIQNASFKIESGTNYTQSISIRFSLWWLALKSIQDNNLLFGAGTGDVESVMKKTGEKFQISNILNSYDPHNQFLHTLLSLGAVGFVLLIGCLFLPFLRDHSIAGNFLYTGFVLMVFVTCLTESVFEMQKGIVFFSIFNSLFVFQFERSELPMYHATHA